jgi:putative aldouronate transport system substrate-binding protein
MSIVILFILMIFLILYGQRIIMPADEQNTKDNIINDNKITLTWYVNIDGFKGEWGSNIVSKAVTRETGVTIKFITSGGSFDDYLNVLISADSTPDIITLNRESYQINKLINQNAIWSLNELDNKYNTRILDNLDKRLLEKNSLNGNLFFYPGAVYFTDARGMYNLLNMPCLLVRSDIYDKLGKPDMSNLQNFFQALKDSTEYNVIPLGLEEFTDIGCRSIDDALLQFLAIPSYVNNEAYDYYNDDDFLLWLNTLSSAYRQRLIDKSAFTDTYEQICKKIKNGEYFAFIGDISYFETALQSLEYNSSYKYIVVDPPKNSRGGSPVIFNKGLNYGLYATMISKNCKYPEKAFEILSFLASQKGQEITYLGERNTMWTIKEDEVEFKPCVLQSRDNKIDDYNKIYGGFYYYFMLANFDSIKNYPLYQSEVLKQAFLWREQYAVNNVDHLEVEYAVNVKYITQHFLIQQEWGRTLPRLISAESDREFYSIMDNFYNRTAFCLELIRSEKTRYWREIFQYD